jgi:monoterpene epsilon-lactone hydrolase
VYVIQLLLGEIMSILAITGIVVLATVLVILVWLNFRHRSDDHSQYDQPVPPLMKAASEISSQHLNVVKKLNVFTAKSTTNIKARRQQMDDFFAQSVDSQIIPVVAGGVSAEWVLAEGANPDQRLLYIHGGAFLVGSPKSHRYIASELSRLAGVSVLSIAYRMQPEFKTINCHEDCRIAYDWILNNGPKEQTPVKHLFVAGDSAGGNLTLALIAWARDNGLRQADGAIALAPVTDSTFSSPSLTTNIKSDPFLGPAMGKIVKMPRFFLRSIMSIGAGRSVNDPEISPLLGDLSNLPPTLVQVSKDEMLFNDSLRYANKAISQHGDVTLQIWPTMVHVFQGFGPDLPEANDALGHIRDFIRSKLS